MLYISSITKNKTIMILELNKFEKKVIISSLKEIAITADKKNNSLTLRTIKGLLSKMQKSK